MHSLPPRLLRALAGLVTDLAAGLAPGLAKLMVTATITGIVLLGPGVAEGAPVLRKSVDQQGDFVIFGNTLGYDCNPGTPAPVVGTLPQTCGENIEDTSLDILWRADDPQGGQASASAATKPEEARSTAVLTLPPGSRITYARLYWGAQVPTGSMAGQGVKIERPGGFQQDVKADGSFLASGSVIKRPMWDYYQSTADITALVQQQGTGPYRVSGVTSINLQNLDDPVLFMGWSVVVFYENQAEPPRNLTLFDGLDMVYPGSPATATLTGFLVPSTISKSKLGVIAYEGDNTSVGDSLIFNGAELANETNPADDFFNASRTVLGAVISNEGDLPRVAGGPGSVVGLDMDVADITPLLLTNQTMATISATSAEDIYFLGAFVTSVSTTAPGFEIRKTFINQNGLNQVNSGDTVEYSISVRNNGSDTGIGVILKDPLPEGLIYLQGSIQISSGLNVGPKSDAPGDDQGEYDASTRTITVRLGNGADASVGGRISPSDPPTIVKFKASVDPNYKGMVKNKAIVTTSSGKQNMWDSGDPTTFTVCDPQKENCGDLFRFAGGGPPQGCSASLRSGTASAGGVAAFVLVSLCALFVRSTKRRKQHAGCRHKEAC